jgi:cobalt/nickel transport system permease protein
MHIPEGYLSPQTCGVMGAVMIPIWATASKKVARNLSRKTIPVMAMGAAFSFIIMMFNVPIPGGTTAHAVGATLLAVTLGPWAASIAISITLIIQALLFGDGGVLALGANCFNMAVLAPFCGYLIYQLLSRIKGMNPAFTSGIAAYIGINFAALAAAVELGLQPLLFHTAAGTPLYFPYALNQTILAMLLAHLTIAGIAEAVITGLVVYYLQRIGEEHILYKVSTKVRRLEP